MLDISNKLMENILKYSSNPTEVSNKIKKYNQIYTAMVNMAKERNNKRILYENSLKEIRQREKNLQEACDHPDVVKYPDPSGGNDSSYKCGVCQSWFSYNGEWNT